MDFTLSNEQRSWQMTARKFAEEEIRPISLERDEIADPRETFDWEIIKKGSKLGFRTMAVPKECGGLQRGAEAPLPQTVPGGRHLPARQGDQRGERGLRQPAAAGRSQGRSQAQGGTL